MAAASGKFYDELETRDPEAREAGLMAALPGLVARARETAPAFGRLLADIDPATVNSRAALAALPVTRKSSMMEIQKDEPPFGGLVATGLADLAHVFASPGPIFDPEGTSPDYWHAARGLYAVGIRPGDLIHNTFSYHMTPAAWMVEGGARALGCPVFPGGVGNTEQQVEAMHRLRPAGYTGTPSFLKILLDKAAEMGLDIGGLKAASAAAEPLPVSLREELEDRGIRVREWYGTADMGCVAYQTEAREGMIVSEEMILEIVRPGTGNPVSPGEVGEMVITHFNDDYPLIRFAPGDMTMIMPGVSPCGRTNIRIHGWMGRADQATKVRGMFVRPEQIAEIVSRHPEIGRARLVVGTVNNLDAPTLRCEAQGDDRLAPAVAETFRTVCKVRCEVELTAPGTLPNDGKVIDDTRVIG